MLATIALSLSMVVFAQSTTETPVAEDLVERHIEVSGGMHALADLKGMHRVWSLESGDFTGTLETNWSPEAYCSTVTSADGNWSMAWGQDAKGAWQKRPDGKVVKTPRIDALMLKLQADPGALLRRDDYLHRLVVTNLVQLPSGSAWRVVASPKLGRVMTLFFNEDNGRLVGAEYWRTDPDGKRMHVEATYDDWRSKGPLQMAFRVTETSHLGKAVLELTELDIRPVREAEVARLDPSSPPTVKPTLATTHHARLLSMLGDTITSPDGARVSSDFIAGKKNVLLYFSAMWCPPCRAFTPSLVQYTNNSPEGDYVVLLVSSDKTAADMATYMRTYDMPFGSVDFARTSAIRSAWAGGGIPNLVWLGPDDSVIKGSYETNGTYSPQNRNSYIGPQRVLEAFKKR